MRKMGIGLGVGINRSNYAQGIFNAYSARVVADGGVVESGTCVDAVSSLLQSASLLLIPSGYKGGKLYAEIPTNGNGDLTWTRGSDAFRTNASGLIQRVPWNLLQQSQNFADTSWVTLNSTRVSTTQTDPSGYSTALNVTWASGGSKYFYRNQSGLTVGTTYTLSFYVKSSNSSKFRIYSESLAFTTSNLTSTSDFARYTLTFTATVTSGTIGLQAASDNTAADLIVAFAQLVEGTTAQTYLPTTDRLNFPRLSYMYGSCPSALLEPQRTNVVLWSSDLSQSVWAKANYTLTSATAIQGLTATRITKNATNNGLYAGSGSRNVINSVGAFASGTKAFSVLLRKGNTAKVGLLINQILIGASVSASCEFDFETETFTNISSGLTATFEKPTTDVYRLILVVNETGTGTSKALWIAPIDSSNNTVTDGYVDVAYFQWEAGAYPTTYIPTTSATATRVADSFSRNNIYTNGLISASGGTWFVELRGNLNYVRDSGGFGISLANNNTTYDFGFLILTNAGGAQRISILKRVSGIGTSIYTTTTDTTKIAIKWNGSTADVFANGTKVVSATSFTTTQMELLTANILDTPKFIQQMALFPTPLSDTDCATLTT